MSFDSAAETDDDRCNCGAVEARSKRTMSPCARIKRFFHAQKRRESGNEDTFTMQKRGRRVSERTKTGKSGMERAVAQKSVGRDDRAADQRKSHRRKSVKHRSSRGKVVNREKRARAVKHNRKDTSARRPLGCICEMCKLFNVAGEGGCNEKGDEQQRLTRIINR